ncbi:MAG: phospholipase [Ferruginibacter sp.]|nr:phospholipase [Ferruginibacter sp.]
MPVKKRVYPKNAGTYSIQNKVKVIYGGKEYFDLLLSMINAATESIHLQTYIYDDDATGLLVADALKAAAKREVEVHLLTDGYASQHLSKKFIDGLAEAGVHFRFFEPLLKSHHYYFGRRLHQKVFVADGKYAIVGGRNIADRYNDLPGSTAWLDFALYAAGEVATELCVLCWKTWNGFPVKMDITPCEKKQLVFSFSEHETTSIRVRRNDWVRRKNEISATYIEMLRQSQSHITILCSYFLPGKIIRRLLKHAAKRGVKITVITAGPSDVILAKNAERWLYDWLLRNNIKLYEYQPAILHAKVAVCDGEWLTIGSYNINNISAYASIELNLDVRNATLAGSLDQTMETIIKKDCVAITSEGHIHTKNIFKQFIRWGSYQFIRIAFYVLTFYFKQRR